MLGILRPCTRHLDDDLRDQWRAHLCGLCLSLRDHHGQAYRAITNTDAVMLSILVAAQHDSSTSMRTAGPCPLRAMRRADVIDASDLGIRLGTTASLTLASARAADVVAEREHGLARQSRVQSWTAGRAATLLRRRALADGGVAPLVDVDALLADPAASAQAELTGQSLTAIIAPTARSTSAVFAASAELAGIEANRAPLADIGADFGAFAHLIDAVTDRAEDVRRGDFNPLEKTGTTTQQVRADCLRLYRAVVRRFDDLALHDDRLLRITLLGGMHHALHRVFDTATVSASDTPTPDGFDGLVLGHPTDLPTPNEKQKERWRDRCFDESCDCGCDSCCDCCGDDGCCSSCNCCDSCDCGCDC
ncbi:DUF5685 family protein [Gordonia sp. CPCC 205333]|uniref:DUF5685 family protein n=1 Tax=Gordonia sp. CPCC 205333 TaxID=3140790 RepID=UPI003AF34B15